MTQNVRTPKIWTVILAAGAGHRFGTPEELPKQFQQLGDPNGAKQSVLDWAVTTATGVSDGVVVTIAPDMRDVVGFDATNIQIIDGGVLRSDSVRNALAVIGDDVELILIHDAARPLATPDTYERVINALKDGADAVVPIVDIPDTLRHRHPQEATIDKATAHDGIIQDSTVDRSTLVAVQTPQGFRANIIREAHASSDDATDDATLVERLGYKITMVDGDRLGTKVTHQSDLRFLNAQLAPAHAGIRIGHGYDSHAFSDDPSRKLILGGVTFESERGLAGHSDADVIAHAVTDALLAAANLPDIGQMFPDTDPVFKDANSLELLSQATQAVESVGWSPVNASVTVVLDAPRIAPMREKMSQILSEAVGAPVTVTGKSTEGTGAAVGVTAHAVALVTQ